MRLERLTVEVKLSDEQKRTLRRFVKRVVRKANKIKWTHPRYGRRKCR